MPGFLLVLLVGQDRINEVLSKMHETDQGMEAASNLLSWFPIEAHLEKDSARKRLGYRFEPIIKARREGNSKSDNILQWLVHARYRTSTQFPDHEFVEIHVAGLFSAEGTSRTTSILVAMHLLHNENL